MKIPATKNEVVDQSLDKWCGILQSGCTLGEIISKDVLCYYSYQKILFHVSNRACLEKCILAQKHGACNQKRSIYNRTLHIIVDHGLESTFLD